MLIVLPSVLRQWGVCARHCGSLGLRQYCRSCSVLPLHTWTGKCFTSGCTWIGTCEASHVGVVIVGPPFPPAALLCCSAFLWAASTLLWGGLLLYIFCVVDIVVVFAPGDWALTLVAAAVLSTAWDAQLYWDTRRFFRADTALAARYSIVKGRCIRI